MVISNPLPTFTLFHEKLKMPILNYSTKIDAYKTITEIQQALSKSGANKIVIDNKNNLPTALTFCADWNGQMVAFMLPCNFVGVLRAMKKSRKVPNSLCNEEQALRVGWRILKVWIDAQMAIIEAEVASLAEVFLPYAVTKNGTTLFKHIESNNQILLTNG